MGRCSVCARQACRCTSSWRFKESLRYAGIHGASTEITRHTIRLKRRRMRGCSKDSITFFCHEADALEYEAEILRKSRSMADR